MLPPESITPDMIRTTPECIVGLSIVQAGGAQVRPLRVCSIAVGIDDEPLIVTCAHAPNGDPAPRPDRRAYEVITADTLAWLVERGMRRLGRRDP